ncbi:PAS domain-containing protein [Hymenobacter sp. GOD-10R]|uniref:PAS domain-containing protein n=1 Tax=Hymenobacter sp. GOD-10R TaxID=3093922 RepID=UPI002D796452|nr:PAS domain-containing protein [Hymenobacter sp. GOD-10R]WRQ30047.1 PAS domain-containing protein [Hymenobacter sp. GOD-10R]
MVDYQKLFRALPENFLLIAPDADATIVDNTDSHVAVSLKNREEVVGKPFFEAYPATNQNEGAIIADSHEHVRRHLEPHTMPLIRYDLERPAEQGGGFEQRYWQATHYPLLDEQGQLLHILQRTQDVTAQYLAEQQRQLLQRELDEAQARTAFILQSLPVLVATLQPSGEADFFNQRWLDFTGRTLAESVGWGWLDDLHPDDRPTVEAAWQEASQSATEYQVEYRLRRHDGQYRWILVRAVPRLGADGQPTLWVGGGTDIHEQKQMVQELLTSNEEQAALSDQAYRAYQLAEQQRSTFYNLFVQTPAMICILRGPEHRFEFVNPEYQKLFPHRDLIGQPVAEALPEVIEQGFVDLLNNVYETGEPFIGNEMSIMLDQNGDGQLHQRYLNFTYQLFKEAEQKAGITVFAFDVTSLVEARKFLENRAGAPNA